MFISKRGGPVSITVSEGVFESLTYVKYDDGTDLISFLEILSSKYESYIKQFLKNLNKLSKTKK